jgi:hypothetical protein
MEDSPQDVALGMHDGEGIIGKKGREINKFMPCQEDKA